jgi:hypothetical protein
MTQAANVSQLPVVKHHAQKSAQHLLTDSRTTLAALNQQQLHAPHIPAPYAL